MCKIPIKEVIVVEGKYDKSRLSSFLDATIIITDGFRIFDDDNKMALLRKLALSQGLIIFTDSDRAGFLIRNYINSSISEGVKHAYIPDVYGREHRKTHDSKEGKLGVEGISNEILLDALKRVGVGETTNIKSNPITKLDLYEDGISGRSDSYAKRKQLLEYLTLPERMSANALLRVLNIIYDRDGYKTMLQNFGLCNCNRV